MTIVPGPIPLPIVTLFCQAGEQRCQHLTQDGIYWRCGATEKAAGYKAILLMDWDADNRLRSPAWCPLRNKQ